MKNRAKAVLGTAVGMAVAVLVPTAAHAATAADGLVTICNVSQSAEYGQFPYRGGFATSVLGPGRCWAEGGFVGLSSDEVVGYRDVNGVFEAVAYEYFNDANGVYFAF